MTAVLHSPATLALRPPAILDVEASGFGRGSYPIEVGLVEPAGTVFCSLIHPEPDWLHWDPEAERVHGISRDILLQHGKAPAWVAAEINARLCGQTVYCDAWAHDYPWLARLFDSVDMVPTFQLQDLRCLLSEQEAARWHLVREQVREELKLERHRASSDARVLQMALLRLKTQAQAQPPA